MQCPRDHIELKRRPQGLIQFHFCEACHGMWFQKSDLQVLLDAAERARVIKPAEIRKVDRGMRRAPGACPVDGRTSMEQSEFHGIQIDICRDHQGVWLDGGELDQLLKSPASIRSAFQRRGKDLSFSSQKAGKDLSAGEVVAVVFDLLFTILEVAASAF